MIDPNDCGRTFPLLPSVQPGRVRPAKRLSPPVLTGGESPQTARIGFDPAPPLLVLRSHQADTAKIDWFTVTWLPARDRLAQDAGDEAKAILRAAGLRVHADPAPGLYGYESGLKLWTVLDDGGRHMVGRIDWGGAKHGHRARLDLSGSGCGCIERWALIHDWVVELDDWTITRCDLAADLLQGEYTVEDAAAWLASGEFNNGGRPPRHSTPGDWLSPSPQHGRTLEVGRRTNGKMLRAYEKGLQLAPGTGDRWTRFEVELRNIDRELPADILLRPSDYFAGAYKCLQRVLARAGVRIATLQKEGFLSIQALREHCSSGYGRYINVLREVLTADQVLDAIARPGVPRRLEKATVAGFQASESPLDYLFQGSI